MKKTPENRVKTGVGKGGIAPISTVCVLYVFFIENSPGLRAPSIPLPSVPDSWVFA
jgi:hypothetical protein